jgi:ATP-dependent Clp protease ATP-binding subunit ClpA
MTKKKPDPYRIVCNKLNLILLIKNVSEKEEVSMYKRIRKFIKDNEIIGNIGSYKEYIIKQFLLEPDLLIEQIKDFSMGDDEDYLDCIDSAYECVLGIYPMFALEAVCADLNMNTAIKGLDKSFFNSFLHSKKSVEEKTLLASLGSVSELENYLTTEIIGQPKAVKAILKRIKLQVTGLSKNSSLFFVGPTGVGKTQLAKLLGNKYGNYYKINCAEYAGGHEYSKLIGSPPGYVGHSEKSLLAEKAEKSNRWVFLFDEIEKAHHKFYDFLLSLLDDGTCTDNMGATLDFSESIFIFTSNKGVSEIKRNLVGFKSDRKEEQLKNVEIEDTLLDSMKKHFAPEFLNRIDEIVVFNPLSRSDIKEIVIKNLKEIPINITQPLIDLVVTGGYSQEYGARNISRFIENTISVSIAEAMLDNKVPKIEGDSYTPRVVKGKVQIVNTKKYKNENS